MGTKFAKLARKPKALTAEEFAVKARVLHEASYGDPEGTHAASDRLMEDTLIALGYAEGVDVIRDTKRWYS